MEIANNNNATATASVVDRLPLPHYSMQIADSINVFSRPIASSPITACRLQTILMSFAQFKTNAGKKVAAPNRYQTSMGTTGNILKAYLGKVRSLQEFIHQNFNLERLSDQVSSPAI
ncbi:hypothetical protein V6Z12_D10G291300 [Gossypium hirsutum]